ncbi:MAG: carbohydrate ABC transporter permease [Thermomicrobiales bacterium]
MAVATGTRTRAEHPTIITTAKNWLVRRGLRKLILIGGLTVFTIWTLFPFVWIIETSLKTDKDLYQQATLIPKQVTLTHYDAVLNQTGFLTYFKNSLIVATTTTIIAMVIGVLSAYAITRLAFRGRTFVARTIIVTYLVPATLLFIPIFQIAQQLHLTNKAAGLIVI